MKTHLRKFWLLYVLVVLILGASLHAQTSTAKTNFNTVFEMLPTYVPATATDVITRDVRVEYAYLANGPAAVTCRISDKSTNCNGGTCPLWPDIAMTAGQVMVVPLNNIPAIGGFTWSCSSANAVVGYMRGKY